MVHATGKLRRSRALAPEDAEETEFLRSMPWILDAHPQSGDPLTSALAPGIQQVQGAAASAKVLVVDRAPRHEAAASESIDPFFAVPVVPELG